MYRHIRFAGLLLFTVLAVCSCASRRQPKVSLLGEVNSYESVYRLIPEDHLLSSELRLTWTPAALDTFFFMLHKDLQIGHLRAGGADVKGELRQLATGEDIPARLAMHHVKLDWDKNSGHLALYALPVNHGQGDITIEISCKGPINDEVEVPEFSRWEIADETTGLISEKGAFLVPGTGFYPLVPGQIGLSRFETTILTPENWEGLVEGNLVQHLPGSAQFTSVHPLDGSYLVAGPYLLDTLMVGNTEISMYHYQDDPELVDSYLQNSARYIAMYDELLGPYAFDRFSVVENWFPTGYGMPSYTLLGTDVLKLPFIVYTSLGHEILHNWWGNGVLVDYDSGNWCEGLTVYQADYEYSAMRDPNGKRQYRLDLLRDYSDYVVRGEDKDFPLSEFSSRTNAGSRTIGYGKCMMTFHMAENRIGHDLFTRTLRDIYRDQQFRIVSWSDFFNAFETASGQDFGWFEKQWIERPSAPGFEVRNPVVQTNAGGSPFLLEFDLAQVQDAPPFRLDLPVRLHFADDSTADHVLRDVNGELYHARVPASQRPVRFDVDPDYDVFRILDPREAPPTLSGFYGSEHPVVVLPDSSDPLRDAYRQLADALVGRSEPEYVTSEQAASDSYDGRAMLRFGRERESKRVLEMDALTANPPALDQLALVWADRNPDSPTVVQMDVWAASADALAPLARKLPHYGKYSYLAFYNGENIAKGQWEVADSPLMVKLPQP